MKVVRAIRRGRILPSKPKTTSSQSQFYAIWNDEPPSSHVPLPAPKPHLPTHSESYNPPEEYLPTAEERKEWEATDKEDRERDYLSQKYSTLRLVPAYVSVISHIELTEAIGYMGRVDEWAREGQCALGIVECGEGGHRG
ncbi:NUC169 domain-containing protein [Lactarius indigo]|nr:NUC169 domain-containing protein [Lactarius indigo]